MGYHYEGTRFNNVKVDEFDPADFDFNGAIDGDELALRQAAFGLGRGANADVDGDGELDAADFLDWERQTITTS